MNIYQRHILELIILICTISFIVICSFYLLFYNAADTDLDTTLPRFGVAPFYEGCGITKLCFGSPSKCIQDVSCKAAVSILHEDGNYTFELRAVGSPAYVATGLSMDKFMGADSSMECQQIGGIVTAHTSWTYPKVDPYTSRIDVPQGIIKLLNASYADGVLACKFTRDAVSTIKGVTFNLNSNKYHVQILSGSKIELNNIGYHDKACDVSKDKVSLSVVVQLSGSTNVLIKLHGVLMLIAWMGTTTVGFLLPRYYRKTWVGKTLRGNEIWFAGHSYLMSATWILTLAGFTLIMIALDGWTATGDNPHAILGLTTVVICFIQPFVAIGRPHPNNPKRVIFNWAHGLLGYAAHILGMVTIFFGVFLKKGELPVMGLYILILIVISYIATHGNLAIASYLSNKKMDKKQQNGNEVILSQDTQSDQPYSRYRKVSLIIYATVNIWCILAIIVLYYLSI